MDNLPTLALMVGFKIKRLADDQIVITRKFIEAVTMYQSLWDGPVKVLLEEETDQVDEVDQKVTRLRELPFEITFVDYTAPDLVTHLQNCVVLGCADHRQNRLSQLCREQGIPCVYTAEYTLKTRLQIIDVTASNPLLRWRRQWWTYQQERRQQRAIALADGLQCNGYPIFEAYRPLNRNPLLYLDTRITAEMMATPADVQRRANLRADKPLQLVFSGRLNEMKGADHLLDVAAALKRLQVPYHLYISGAGTLEPAMQQRIQQTGLTSEVTMMGVPDFKSDFYPFVKANIDLFICCHRQGDPSCTYVETMSAGVPIVGYGNEAFEQLNHFAGGGWVVPLNRPEALAQQVAALARDRAEITQKAIAAQQFAQHHTFLETFRRRVRHLEAVYLATVTRPTPTPPFAPTLALSK